MKRYNLEIFKYGKMIKIKNTLVRTPLNYIITENDINEIKNSLTNIYGFNEKDFKITEIKEKTKDNKNKQKTAIIVNDKKKEKVTEQNITQQIETEKKQEENKMIKLDEQKQIVIG